MSKAKPKRLLLLVFLSSEGLFGIQKEVTTKNDLNAISKKVSFLSTYWDDAFLTDDKRVAEPCFKTMTSKKSEAKTSFFASLPKSSSAIYLGW